MIIIFLNFIGSSILSFILTFLSIKIAHKYNIFDYPAERKIHKEPIPRTGGLAIVFTFLIVVSLNFLLNKNNKNIDPILLKILPALIPLIIAGVYDDLKGISPYLKLFFQTLTGIILYIIGIKIFRITNPLGGEIHFGFPFDFLLTLLWVVGLINAINLLDGMDGLAGGVVFISSFFIFIIALLSKNYFIMYLTSIVMGICAGFLIHNFPPAKIFMGDTGSMFLGFIMAVIGLLGNRKSEIGITLLIPIVLLLFPIMDTFLAIFRRIKDKKSIFAPDKQHLHHRLLALGIGYKKVLFIIYIINIYLGCIALLSLNLSREYIFILFFILAIGIFIFLEVLKFLEKIKKE